MKRLSAIERLRGLPAIFRGADLTMRFQWTSKTASHYLYLWKQRDLVAPLGGHSDTFANLLVQPQPDWEAALRLAMPSAVVVGIEALRRHGWTTQVPARPEVAVDATQPVFTVAPFVVSPRAPGWFALSRRGIEQGCLHPAWALADLLQREGWGACGLQQDDVEWSAWTDRDRRHFAAAAAAYGMSATAIEEVRDLAKMAE